MNVSDLSLKDLSYVLAIARHQSFSLAALDCAVSQPALSKQIKHLELQLQVKLFERTKRHVALTAAGIRFVEQASTVLDEAEKLLAFSAHHEHPLSGPFRLGAIASVCPYLLPYFVGGLKTAFPDLQLMVIEGFTEDLVSALRQGKLDAVIAAPTFDQNALAEIPLFFEPFLLANRKPDPLTPVSAPALESAEPMIDVTDIDTTRLLLLADGHCLKDQTLALCALPHQETNLNVKATSLETLLQMSAGGLGMAIIPELAKPVGSRLNETLQFFRFRNPTHGRTVALYYRQTYPQRQSIQELAQYIHQQLPPTVQRL